MITDFEKKKAFCIAINEKRFPLIYDDYYWDYLIDEAEELFGYRTDYNRFNELLSEKFNNDINLWNDSFLKARQVINGYVYSWHNLMEIDFLMKDCHLADDMQKIYEKMSNGEYTNSIDGDYYISLDLTAASNQWISEWNMFGGKTLEDILSENGVKPEITSFKGNRVYCFSEILKLYYDNGYSTRLSYPLLSDAYDSDDEIIKYCKTNGKLCGINGDELKFHVGKEFNDDEFINKYCRGDQVINGHPFHIKVYKHHDIFYKFGNLPSKNVIWENLATGKDEWKCRNCSCLPWLMKLYYGKEVDERDKAIRKNFGFIIPKYELQIVSKEGTPLIS